MGFNINPQYNLPGTIDKNQNRKDKTYQDSSTWPTYQQDYKDFLEYLLNDKSHKVIVRVYDGELLFLLGKKKWNIPKRHVSVDLTQKFLQPFKDNVLKCDKFCAHLTIMPSGSMHNLYNQTFGNKKIDYPTEFLYAIVINKWIFKNFKNQIGLIGGYHKIKVIKELMKRKEYRDYLGIDYFTDYVEVPEKYGCDNPEKLEESLKEQLSKSDPNTKIYLFGIGICKMVVANKFKDFYPATYIDIGGTMSGLAGFLSVTRPYAANWMNYRLRNYNYSKVDPIDMGDNENITYLD
jgi:hypothetical protein